MLTPLGKLLPKRLAQHGLSTIVGATVVCSRFDEAVAATAHQFVGEVRAARFVGGELTVYASSSAAASAVRAHLPRLAEETNRRLGKPIIERVRLQVRFKAS